MLQFNKIWWFENEKRIKYLAQCRQLFERYFDQLEYPRFADFPVETDNSSELRDDLNRDLQKLRSILLAVNVNTVGTVQTNHATLMGANLLHYFTILNRHNQRLLRDYLIRAEGIYEGNKKSAFIRTINPLFYLNFLLTWIAHLPITWFADWFGKDLNVVQQSRIGRVISGCVYLITLLSGIATLILTYADRAKIWQMFN
ncbi:hypothetical protein PsAD5_00538 [Pseudovibrio sp. Ad5]|nr:hypothetical protein PsAD5_00538 [Pseudovibrio sp. Ad5]